MRRVKIADAPTQRRDYRLRRHRFAFVVSIFSILKVSSMPLTAYLSEYLPWRGSFSPPETYANYSDFNAMYLAANQRLYSNETLPTGAIYIAESAKNMQVARALVSLNQPPMETNACLSDLLLGLPGLVYYTEPQVEMLCRTLTTTNNNNTTIDGRGSCFHSRLCSLAFGRSCLWLVPGDAISSPTARTDEDATLATLYFASESRRDALVVWCTFIYRICTTLMLWSRLWSRYYRHCAQLESLVRRCGHRVKMPSGTWTYELVYGDPTAIVLLDPMVATLYCLDIWLSVMSFGTAAMQIQSSTDMRTLVFAIVYLTRSVWFAYWGLCLVSVGLKALRKEYLFSEVDPTLIAIAVTIYAPIMTYLNGRLAILTRFYQWLFSCLVPKERREQDSEAVLVCIVFTLLTVSAPLMTRSLLFPAPQRRLQCECVQRLEVCSRLALCLGAASHPTATTARGSIYHLLEMVPQLKRCPTISLRGTDCFLVCYRNGKLHERLRLSLLTNVNIAEVPRSNEATEFVVHELQTASPGSLAGLCLLSTRSNFELCTPPEPSLWCV